MKRERTFVARCLNPTCGRDPEPGHMGYCSACGQAVRRRIKKGEYVKEDLAARGKVIVPSIDNWLKQ